MSDTSEMLLLAAAFGTSLDREMEDRYLLDPAAQVFLVKEGKERDTEWLEKAVPLKSCKPQRKRKLQKEVETTDTTRKSTKIAKSLAAGPSPMGHLNEPPQNFPAASLTP